MAVQDQRDDTGDQTTRPDEHSKADTGAVQNTVTGTVSGGVVQAHTITGGIHHHHPARPDRVVPRQLPGAPRHFVGRAAELAQLAEQLDTAGTGGTVLISALTGAGGIGKTWLALHYAHRHSDRFPDGQLFVDLQGFSPAAEPMPAAVAVRGFLDALGADPGRIPAGTHAQAALYRSLVAGKQMLIVLDNAAAADQVTPLLPASPSCTVIVTSRRRLTSLVTAHGAHPVHLDVLTRTEAQRLLITRFGLDRAEGEPGAVAELLALCGGFPLALAIVAGHARTSPRLPLTALAGELREAATRMDVLDGEDSAASLPAVLSWSLRTLTSAQREVFGLLGAAPGPDIALPAAAALTGLPAAQVKRLLRALEEASLLDHDGHGRWRMHDLIRTYATATVHQHLDEDVRTSALLRVLDYYVHTAHAAALVLEPQRPPIDLDPPAHSVQIDPPPDALAAMAWFGSEHINLLAAQDTAAAHHRHLTVWQLAWALYNFHARQGRRRDLLTVWRAAVDAAAHLPDPAVRTRAHRVLGFAYIELDLHEEAIEHLDRALALAEHHHDPAQQAHTHHTLARAYEKRGDDRRALDHARHALDLYRTLGQPAWEASALNAVGWYAARNGDHDTARTHCQAALTLQRLHLDPGGEAHTRESLGSIDRLSGRHAEAIGHYRQGLTLYRDLGDIHCSASTLDQLGHCHAALGEHKQTRAMWQEALELYREQGRDEDVQRMQRQLDDLDGRDGEQPSQTTESAK